MITAANLKKAFRNSVVVIKIERGYFESCSILKTQSQVFITCPVVFMAIVAGPIVLIKISPGKSSKMNIFSVLGIDSKMNSPVCLLKKESWNL